MTLIELISKTSAKSLPILVIVADPFSDQPITGSLDHQMFVPDGPMNRWPDLPIT